MVSHILTICSGTSALLFFDSPNTNLMKAKMECDKMGLAMVQDTEFVFHENQGIFHSSVLPLPIILTESGTIGVENGDSFVVVGEEFVEDAQGFLCVKENSSFCSVSSNTISVCLEEMEFLMPTAISIPSVDEAIDLCTNSFMAELSSITTQSEFRLLSSALIYSNTIANILTNMLFLANENLIENIRHVISEEIISLEEDFFIDSFGDFPWFQEQPEFNNLSAHVILKRFAEFEEPTLSTKQSISSINGVLCIIEDSPDCEIAKFVSEIEDDSVAESEEDSVVESEEDSVVEDEADFVLLIVGGVGIFLLLGLVIALPIAYRRATKKSNNQRVSVKKKKLEEGIENVDIVEKSVADTDDDTFSIYTGISEIQSGISSNLKTITSQFSRRTEITALDKAQSQMVKSIISSSSALSVLSRNVLRVSPFVNNVRNSHERRAFIVKVSLAIQEQLVELDVEQEVDESFCEFNAESVPPVEIGFYIRRLINGLDMWFNEDDIHGDENTGFRAFLLTIHFLRKVKEKHELTKFNIHKILCTSFLVAAKFIEDDIITNRYWADIAGIDIEEVTDLEQLFCFSLGFNFDIEEGELEKSFDTFSLKQAL